MPRDRLTREEYWWIHQALNEIMGTRPPKSVARGDLRALGIRWAWGSVRGWTERKLRNQDRPASKAEIYRIVERYAKRARRSRSRYTSGV